MTAARQRWWAVVALLAATALTAGACSSKREGGTGAGAQPRAATSSSSGTSSTTPSSAPTTSDPPAAPLASLQLSPQSGAGSVNPLSPITASVTGGQLSAVQLTNTVTGKAVAGTLSADKSGWKASEVLGYGKSYRLTATATNAEGKPVSKSSTFTTLTPGNMTMPYMQYTGGYALTNGATYGVGIVPVVHFDEPITDKAAAEKTLQVTTTPHVNGSWYWADDQNVHFRPQNFWPAGTKVTITAKVYGQQVSPGLYGQSDVSVSFSIGRRQVTIADDSAPQVNKVRVYNAAGQVIRTMNTSMGRHSGVTYNGKYINFYTMDGTYTVLEHDNPAIMSSETYGLPANAPGGYAPEKIYWSTKISTDGIYLHELDSTVWDQDNGYDVSHGCLNLNHDNAVWYYNNSMIGDPVIIHGTQGAPEIQIWQGGDWSVPWSTWVAGSALH